MKYTWPKFKLCRREQVDLFGAKKYAVKKKRGLPGQHGASMQRSSEYGKLLRNKQTLKRLYLLSEKQFSKIVKEISAKHAKNSDVTHDTALFQFLERRMDTIILRAWFAKTIIQARQMANHSHFLLNEVKHNIPSTFLKVGDKLVLKEKLKTSPLFSQNLSEIKNKVPSWIKVDKSTSTIEVLGLPKMWEIGVPADILKVIEFYARA